MRLQKTLLTIWAVSLFLVGCVSPQHQTEWRIPSTESFVIHSSAAGRDFEITVAIPRGYSESQGKYPVLYVLDANGWFSIAVEAARLLTISRDLKEEPVIVGIGYPVGLFWNTLSPRFKDLTPTSDPDSVREASKDSAYPPPEGSGGAVAFLEGLSKEVMPVVESRYRLDGRRRALHGHSLGGLFALFTLFRQPDLFSSYVISSPSIWWDHEVTWKFEQEFAQTHKDLHARVLLTVGALEDQSARYRMVSNVRKLDDLFRSRNYEKFLWRTEVFENL